MNTTIVYCSDPFAVPAQQAPVVSTAAMIEVSELTGSLKVLAGWMELSAMIGLVAVRPSVTSIWSRRACAVRSGSAWVIDMVEDGQRIYADANMSLGSMVMESASFESSIATQFSGPTLHGEPAFWTAFVEAAETGFGAGTAGWVPLAPGVHDGVFGPLAIELQAMSPGAEWYNTAAAGARLIGAGSDGSSTAWLELTFARSAHGVPAQVTLSSPAFGTVELPLDYQYTTGLTEVFGFSASDAVLTGALVAGGAATITATVQFE